MLAAHRHRCGIRHDRRCDVRACSALHVPSGTTLGRFAEYIPRAYNIGLAYIYKKWGATYDVNYTAGYPVVVGLTTAGAFTTGSYFRRELTIMNASVSYKVHPYATLFASINNIEQQGPERYTYTEERTRSVYIVPRSIKFGVNGQF